MGAYAPAPVATPEILDRIVKECLRPTIDGMRKEGTFNTIGRNFDWLISEPRLPLPRRALHRIYAHGKGTQGSRV